MDGKAGYILEYPREGKGSITLTKTEAVHGNDKGSAMHVLAEAVSRLTKPTPITIYTRIPYIASAVDGIRDKKSASWLNKAGEKIAYWEQWDSIMEKLGDDAEIYVEVNQPNEYTPWLINEVEKR